MGNVEIDLVCGLVVQVGCQDRLCEDSDADETLVRWESRYVKEVLPHSCETFFVILALLLRSVWRVGRAHHRDIAYRLHSSFKAMSQRCRGVGNTESDLTGSRFELQTSRSRDESLPLDQLAELRNV